MRSRLQKWAGTVTVTSAAAVTIWAIAEVAINLMWNDYPPWGLYLLWFLLLAMVWSGLSMLRWKTNLGFVVFLLSAMYALPLGLLIVALSFGD